MRDKVKISTEDGATVARLGKYICFRTNKDTPRNREHLKKMCVVCFENLALLKDQDIVDKKAGGEYLTVGMVKKDVMEVKKDD